MDNNVYLIRNQYSWVADNISDFKTMAGENEIMILYPPNTFKPVIRLLEKGKTGAFKFRILKEIKIAYLQYYILLQGKLIAWKLKNDDSNSVRVGKIRGIFNLHYIDKESEVVIGVDSINTKDYKNIFLNDIDKVWIAGS